MYKPPLVRVPIDGLRLQVTDVLLVPVTVAVNCCWPLTVSVADGGLTDTATGAGPVSKNRAEITALPLPGKLVTRTCTCPLSCHTRYCPLWKLLTFCVFSKTPLAS